MNDAETNEVQGSSDNGTMSFDETLAMVEFYGGLTDAEDKGGKELFKYLSSYGIKCDGYVASAEGIRIPFDRERALERVQQIKVNLGKVALKNNTE